MSVAEYTIESVESRPFAQNSYIIWRQGRQDAIVIDPGFDTESILDLLSKDRPASCRDPQHAWPRRIISPATRQ